VCDNTFWFACKNFTLLFYTVIPVQADLAIVGDQNVEKKSQPWGSFFEGDTGNDL
jgi:hypothetical protein